MAYQVLSCRDLYHECVQVQPICEFIFFSRDSIGNGLFVIFGFSIVTFALLRPAYQLGLRGLQKMHFRNQVLLNSHSATWILTAGQPIYLKMGPLSRVWW